MTVEAVAALERRGVFAERGYQSARRRWRICSGWERFEARRRVVAAEQVTPRVGLDGALLPARLPATAAVFADGSGEPAARRGGRPGARLDGRAAVVARSSGRARRSSSPRRPAVYTPSELQAWGAALVEALDQDGEEPDDRPPAQVNELHLTRLPVAGAGRSRAGSTTRRCSTRSPRWSTRRPGR